MDISETRKRIKEFSWYQTICFEDDLKAKGCDWCGDPAWKNIIKLLPESLEGKRILDLGSNAGIFCVRSALMGAKEIIGVESNDWKEDDYFSQALLVRDYFEQKHNTEFNITYIKERMEDFLSRDDLGFFDYVYGIASLYYSKDYKNTIKGISKITNNVIARLRDKNRIERFYSGFIDEGFECVGEIREKWWEVLNRKTDDFYLFHFRRNC